MSNWQKSSPEEKKIPLTELLKQLKEALESEKKKYENKVREMQKIANVMIREKKK